MAEFENVPNPSVGDEQEQAAAALEEWRKQEAALKNARIRRADKKILCRAAAYAVFDCCLIEAAYAGLMAPILAAGVLVLASAQLGFHAGAWFQFRFEKEDKLHG